MRYRLRAPTGKPIIGTLEIVTGCAFATVYAADKTHELDPEYSGETDIDWDSQVAVVEGDQRVYVNSDGGEWPEDQLERVPVTD